MICCFQKFENSVNGVFALLGSSIPEFLRQVCLLNQIKKRFSIDWALNKPKRVKAFVNSVALEPSKALSLRIYGSYAIFSRWFNLSGACRGRRDRSGFENEVEMNERTKTKKWRSTNKTEKIIVFGFGPPRSRTIVRADNLRDKFKWACIPFISAKYKFQ